MNTTNEKTEARSKAIRAMLSGLLGSTISLRELRDLGGVLDEKFVEELRGQIASYVSSAERETLPSYEIPGVGAKSDFKFMLAEHIYLLAKEKRISKERMKRYITQARPGFKFSPMTDTLTVKRIIFDFIEVANEEESAYLMQRVSGSIEEDPYLHGISSGNRR